MIREAPAMTARQNLDELLNEVQYRGDSVLITRGGKPVAAIVDIDLYENIRRMREDFDRLCAELAAAGKALTDADADAALKDSRKRLRADRAPRQHAAKR